MNILLKYSGAAYLLLLMLLKMLGMQIAVLDYTLHKDFIATQLCENKMKPQMHCAGKCYLKKQLSRSSETPASQEQKGATKTFSVDFFEPAGSPGFDHVSAAMPAFPGSHSDRLHHPFIDAVFHPPLIAAV